MELTQPHRQPFTRTPLFWILNVILFIICLGYSLHFYPKAFPIVDLKITLDRQSALKAARQLAEQNHWGPEAFEQASSFDLDRPTQNFVELEAGGAPAFGKMIQEGLYSPYTWRVRHFAEGNPTETEIWFTPAGKLNGFYQKIPETTPGKALPAPDALKIATQAAIHHWKVDLSEYHLEEQAQETQLNGRIDHTFTYERPQIRIGEGRYRMRLSVTGDQLTELSYFIKIPESFSRRYTEMRSFNNTLSLIASTVMTFLYLVGGCGFGLFYLAKNHLARWKPSLLVAGVIALFQFFESLNQLPLAWMSYDTALSSQGFLFKYFTSSLLSFLSEFLMLGVSFIAAEGLTRKAFPKHPQLWKVWRAENASSISILGRTVGGYLGVAVFFSFVIFTYLLGRRYLQWWTPSDTLFQPDALASYLPWFTAISNSLHAGLWEEALFRALPLASAALLGARFGRRKLGITIGMIIQALIFAAAHANYPAQPYYARVVELILPSLGFGFIYLLFGLLPGILLHFTFDVIFFALPLFSASLPGLWIDQVCLIFFTLLPLWIVFYSRIKRGGWSSTLSPTALNEFSNGPDSSNPSAQADPSKHLESLSVQKAELIRPLTTRQGLGLMGFALVCMGIVLFVLPRPLSYAPTLELQKKPAIELAQKTLKNQGVHLPPSWTVLATTSYELTSEDRFIWKTEGPTTYQQLIQAYLNSPSWMIRFVQFDSPASERAEEYQVFITGRGIVSRVAHKLPEGRAGKTLSQQQARKLALSAAQNWGAVSASDLKEVSSIDSKLPARTDWNFIFSDTSVHLKEGDARVAVRIAGDQVTSTRKFIFIPEAWSRQERNTQNVLYLIRIFSSLFVFIVIAVGFFHAFLNSTQKQLSRKTFLAAFGMFNLFEIAETLNEIPSYFALFSTTEPLLNQWVTILSMRLMSGFISSLCCGLILSDIHSQAKRSLTQLRQSKHFFSGYSIGIIGAAVTATLHAFLPKEAPIRESLFGMDNYVPLLSGITLLKGYLYSTLVFLLTTILVNEKITRHWTRHRIPGIFFVFCLGFALSGLKEQSVMNWGIVGFCNGACFLLFFRSFIRFHLSLVPLAAACLSCFMIATQISFHPYAGSTLNLALPLGAILIVSYAWHRKLETSS